MLLWQGDAIDHVAERLDRLAEINAELKVTAVHTYLSHHPAEQPERCLSVHDDEVTVPRVLNAEERRAAAAAAAAAAAEAAAVSEETVAARARALKDMMNNRLERPKVSAMEELQRELWMDTEPATWSVEQKKEYKEFQVTLLHLHLTLTLTLP